MVIWWVISISDGVLEYPPVMAFYWFIVAMYLAENRGEKKKPFSDAILAYRHSAKF